MHRSDYTDDRLKKLCQHFDHILFYGLKGSTHSHRFIYISYMDALDRLGIAYTWLETGTTNHRFGSNDLVFIHGEAENLDLVMNGNPYLIDMHVFNRPVGIKGLTEATRQRIIDHPKRLSDIEHKARDKDPDSGILFDDLTYYSREMRYLAQPWGTDLHPSDFQKPAINMGVTDVFFIGTVWKSRWGNFDEIVALRAACLKLGLKLREVSNAGGAQNALLIGQSRFAPTIAGRGQAEAGYLACRFYKNISYGQYCFSNVPLAAKVLDNNLVQVEGADGIEKATLKMLSLSKTELVEGVRFQQEKISTYTIYHHLYLSLVGLLEGI